MKYSFTLLLFFSAFLLNGQNLIISHPQTATVCQGEQATFVVEVAPEVDTFQWQYSNDQSIWTDVFDGSEYSGTNTETLTVLLYDAGQANWFRVIVMHLSEGIADTSETAELIVYPEVGAFIEPNNPIICSGASIDLVAYPANGSYAWNTGETTQVIVAEMAGTYSVTVTSQEGCTGVASVVVSEQAGLTVNIAIEENDGTANDGMFCAGNQVTLTAAHSASGQVSFAWSNGGNTSSIQVSSGGTYTVTVTDIGSACSGTASVTLTANPKPSVTIQIDDNSGNPGDGVVCQGQSIQLIANVTGGTSPFMYAWARNGMNAGTGMTLMVSEAGQYVVEVTDDNGCQASASREVAVQSPVVTITHHGGMSGNVGLCGGDEVELHAEPIGANPFQYMWSTSATGTSIQVNSPGTYQITVVDNFGCSATDDIQVIVSAAPSVNIAVLDNSGIPGDSVVCQGDTILLEANATGSAPFSYLWIYNQSSAPTQAIMVSTSGLYSVVVTDNNACTSTAEIYIEITDAPGPVTLPEPSVVYCQFEMAEPLKAVADSGLVVIWQGFTSAPRPETNTPGEFGYVVYQQDITTLCLSMPDTVNVRVLKAPDISIMVLENSGVSSNDQRVCVGDTMQLVAFGADQYKWHNLFEGDTLEIPHVYYENGVFAYSVTGLKDYPSDSKICTSSKNGSVEVLDKPKSNFETNPPDGNVMEGELILFREISGVGASNSEITNWQWNFGDGAEPPTAQFTEPNNQQLVRYGGAGISLACLDVIDDNLCKDTYCKNITVNQTDGPIINSRIDERARCLGDTVKISIDIRSGGFPGDYILEENVIVSVQNTNPDAYEIVVNQLDNISMDLSAMQWNLWIVFKDYGDYTVEVTVTQKLKVDPTMILQGHRAITINSGLPKPDVVNIDFPGTLCRGARDTITVFLNLSENFNAKINYRVNNGAVTVAEGNLSQGFLKIPVRSDTISGSLLSLKIISLEYENGCINFTNNSIDIALLENPEVHIDGDPKICLNSIEAFQVDSEYDIVTWFTPSGISMEDILEVTGSSIGDYPYKVDVYIGKCVSQDSFIISVVDIPYPNILGDTIACHGKVLTMKVDSPSVGNHYKWIVSPGGVPQSSVNDDDIRIKWTETGWIEVIESKDKCVGRDTLYVTVIEDEAPPYHDIVHLTCGKMLIVPNPEGLSDICYQWRYQNKPILGETYQGIYIGNSDRNNYSVEVRYCSGNKTCFQEIFPRSGTKECPVTDFSVQVVPNPNNGSFNVTVGSPVEGQLRIEVIDGVGRKLYSSTEYIVSEELTVPVHLPYLTPGVYYLRIYQPESGTVIWRPITIVQ